MISDSIIQLRALEPSDVDVLYIWENDSRYWPTGNTRAPLSRFQLSEYVNNYDSNPYSAGQLRLMIADVETGEPMGAVDIYDFDSMSGRAGVGVFVAERYRGKGVASRALRLLGRYCREMLTMHQLWSIVAVTNIASRRLFEQSGYKISGCLKSWIRQPGGVYTDAYIMQRMLDDVRTEQ